MPPISEQLRLSHADLSLHEALRQPVSILLGVDDAAATALHEIGVDTLFDLGSSLVFAQADRAIAGASSGAGVLASDLLKPGGVAGPVEDVPSLPLEALRGMSDELAATLKTALHVDTLRDFALWPPRQAAGKLVEEAQGRIPADAADGELEKFRPALGTQPTERVYYDKLIMFGRAGDEGLTPLDDAVSLRGAGGPEAGLARPAVGALVTMSQAWFSEGIILGDLLHSLPLAPGEATQIAIVDWRSRREARGSDSVTETERLDSATEHSRAISEVQNAVANEMQNGGSMSDGWARSESSSKGAAASIGGGISGFGSAVAGVLGFGAGGSLTSQKAETSFGASSASWSVGSRSVGASLLQNVNDRTEQHASSVRSRRASQVRAQDQAETGQFRTNVIANYNHMYPVTHLFFDLVQNTRAVTRLHAVERVLFVPFETLDFTGTDAADLVARYRGSLLAAAITARAADLLLDPDGQAEIRGAMPVETRVHVGDFFTGGLTTSAAMLARPGNEAGGLETGPPSPPPPTPPPPPPPPPVRTIVGIGPGPVAGSIPGTALLTRISFEGLSVDRLRFAQPDAIATAETFAVSPISDQFSLSAPVRLSTLALIQVGSSGGEVAGTMTLHCQVDGRSMSIPVRVLLTAGTHMQTVAFVKADPVDRMGELIAHLQANRGHYTDAVLRQLRPGELAVLLSRFSWLGRPLLDQVEPVPLAVAANFVVLRAPAELEDPSGLGTSEESQETWSEALEARGIDFNDEDVRMVPMPTGGVFLESVLGRCNAAEKLDITRFWNWQDSPIPLQPSQIAPLDTGSRAVADAANPPQLGAPVLSVMAPAAVPDPSGLAAILGAIASGNMFRDMSGLAGTQAAAQAAASGTLTAATEAGRIASENFKAATQQATEMGKAAADMWKVGQTSKEGKGSSVSEQGAHINHGRDMDERGIKRPESGAGARPAGSPADGTTPAGSGGSGGGSAGGNGASPVANELVRSDSAADFSPTLFGELTDRILPGEVTLAKAPANTPRRATTRTESIKSRLLQSDAQAAAIDLGGAVILPLRMHPNAADFRTVPWLGWTDSDKEIFYDFDMDFSSDLADLASMLKSNGPFMPTPDAETLPLKLGRAFAVSALRHEAHHVAQFKTHGRPTSFKEMLQREITAYQADVNWWLDPNTRNFFLNHLKIPDWALDGPAGLMQLQSDGIEEQNLFLVNTVGMSDDLDIKEQLIFLEKLPTQIRQDTEYTVRQMYKK